MVHATAKTKNEKNTRRISPNKDRTKKKAINSNEKKIHITNQPPEKLNEVSQDPTQTDELLTPEFILKSYVTKKNSFTPDKTYENNKTTSSTNQPANKSVPMEVPVKPNTTYTTPPSTPPRKIPSERFAGLSNSPAPHALPIPSFSFLDQELSKGKKNDMLSLTVPNGTYQQDNSPSSPSYQSHSPPSNPHLESMTSQLRLMLNINP